MSSKMTSKMSDEISHGKIREKGFFQEDKRMNVYIYIYAYLGTFTEQKENQY